MLLKACRWSALGTGDGRQISRLGRKYFSVELLYRSSATLLLLLLLSSSSSSSSSSYLLYAGYLYLYS